MAGIPDEVVAGLEAEGAAFLRPNTYGAGTGITYDPETLKRVWETLVLDAGADVLLHSFVHGVELRRTAPCAAVRLWTKGGERVIRPRVVVDASGDADVCHLAGAPYEATGRGRAGAEPLDGLPDGQRGHRSGRGGAEGGALGADARGVGVGRLRAHRGSRARCTARRSGA